MARRTNPSQGKAGSAKSKKTTGKAGSQKQAKPAYGQGKQQQASTPLLDDRTKRDIVGVVLIVLAIALFVTCILTPEGVVTSVLSLGMRYAFGVGAYLLPFLLLVVAITVLVRFERDHVSARVSIGVALIFVSVLTLMAAFTGGAEQDPMLVFDQAVLVGRGGYLGAGIAWACLTLFGLTVTTILMIGLVIVALIIIGFSLSGLIEKARERKTLEDDMQDADQLEGEGQTKKRPRIFRAKDGASGRDAALAKGTAAGAISAQPTQMLGEQAGAHSQKTRILNKDAKGKHGQSATAANETVRLDGTEKADSKQLTRKLSGRRAEDGEGKRKKPASRPAASATATPIPQEGFELPGMSLLKTSSASKRSKESESNLRATASRLAETLSDFGVDATVVDWVPGPTVTLFKVDLPAGVRVSRVTNLTDDIALALAATGVRIFAPVPGTNYVGIEVPNAKRDTVLLGDVLKAAGPGPLQVAIGKDVEGDCIVSDLAKMPHLLIGGTTGSGKSVSINAMIMSILMRATPSEVRMIMIDPKRVEFTPYNGIPHLYVPVVTEPREAASALSWAVAEMERRLKVFSNVGARNIGQYNAKVQSGQLEEGTDEIPYIVIIIDELADLMMNVGKEVEFSISRLAQLARAAGIHLIVATQRPSTNVVTGLIKANITNRIAFNVASGIDSRVILDTPGAENLIGLGDLLLSKPELSKPQRIQGCFVSEDEIFAVVEHLKSQGEPEYHNDILKTNLISMGDTMPDGTGGTASGHEDPLVWEAAEIVCSTGLGSTSNLQRRLSVGYSRAGRIMDLLEEKGIVGPPNGSKPREVLVDSLELETIKAFEAND